MKRTILTTLVAGTALLGANAAMAGQPGSTGVTDYLVESGLLSRPVTQDAVGMASAAEPRNGAEATLVRAGLIEPRSAERNASADAELALEPSKRYLLEINSTNYVEITESLPRG